MNEFFPVFERIAISVVAGYLLGLERQIHRQPAGLKTHILICVGSTLLMLVSLILAGGLEVLSGNARLVGDPGRFAAQVISGIGFLGGGAIIRQGFNIKGLTTAATIWVSAAIGLAIGVGAYVPAAITLVAVLVTLVIMERFESSLFPPKSIKILYLVYEEAHFDYALLARELVSEKIVTGNLDMAKTLSSDRIKLTIQAHIPAHIDYNRLTSTLQKAGKLVKIEVTSYEKPSR
ncbi:MAG TPA: MgtC/SapB family protein [Treponemataceae bacterium]|nr:MgtC/SapB family protein [Treponemataceae bacterium]HPS44684.1 MgtC/SapB family protein [Treponemataceae bacterium]